MRRTAGLYKPLGCASITVAADCLEMAGMNWKTAFVLQVFLDRFMDECSWLDDEDQFGANPILELTHEDISRETMRFVPLAEVPEHIAYLESAGLIESQPGGFLLNATAFNEKAKALPVERLTYARPVKSVNVGV